LAAGKVSGPFWPQPAAASASTRAVAVHPLRGAVEKGVGTLERAAADMPAIVDSAMTTPSEPAPASLSDSAYLRLAHEAFARVEAVVDRWLQLDVVDIDINRVGSLLELTLPDQSKLVLNMQPPLHELWLAARSRGYHFKWTGDRWVDRDGLEFFDTLGACASQQAGMTLAF
jgi:CyaY protein